MSRRRLGGRRALLFLGPVIVVAVALRVIGLGSDPPRWLTDSYAPLIDGPHYVAEAAARAGAPVDPASADGAGGVPPWYRRPLYSAYCGLVYRIAGASPGALALPSALAGAALAPVLFVLFARATGEATAIGLALFAALDGIAVAWSRTSVPYPTLALLAVLAVGAAAFAFSRRERPVEGPALLALGNGLILLAAWGLKVIALFALVPVVAIAWAAGPTGHRSVRRAALAAAALAPWVAVLVRAQVLEAAARLRLYAGDPTFAAAVRRVFHLPSATRASVLAPVVVGLIVAAPVLLRRGRPVSPALRIAERASAVSVIAGALLLAALAQPDTPYLLVFWPAALALAMLSLRALAVGGAPPLARRSLVAGYLAGALAFVAIDALGTARLLGGLVDPYYFGATRFLQTLGVAAMVGVVAAAAAAVWPRRHPPSASPARPRLATGLALVHVASQLVLTVPLVLAPEETLAAARRNVAAILPSGATLGEHFAYALADGRHVRARYFETPAAADALAEARVASITHVAVAADRWSMRVRPRLGGALPGTPPSEVASVYVRGVRVRLARLPGVEARSAFERGRALLEGDPIRAGGVLAEAVAEAPGASLPLVHLAVAEALAGDVRRAAATLRRARSLDDRSFPARVADVFVLLRSGDAAAALAEADAALGLFPDRNLERFRRDLARALAVGDERALDDLRGVGSKLLVEDLLR